MIFVAIFTIHSEELWNLLCNLSDKYYPIMRVWAVFIPVIIIRHPDDVEVKKEIQVSG